MATLENQSDAADAAASEDLRGFRLAQLANTLGFAGAKSPYYRDLLAGIDLPPSNPMDVLATLPPLDSNDWAMVRTQLRTGPLTGAQVGFTSGTTSQPTPYVTVSRELEAYRAMAGNQSGDKLTLVLSNVNHGVGGLAGLSEGCIISRISEPQHFAQASALLEHEQEPYASLPRVGVIDGALFQVRALSLYLLERRGRLDDLGVKQIYVGRNILSEGWKARLSEWWGAEVRSSYGFSEMRVCNAGECDECGYYHMPPTGLVEVLDDEHDWRPVEPGARGLLAMTGFYPFVEIEPRIRYVPGDMAQLAAEPCPRWNEHGFRPLGRRSKSARMESDGRWICPADVYCALADEVAVQHSAPSSLASMNDRKFDDAGVPNFKLETGTRARLHVELRFVPTVWPHEAENVRLALQAKIPEGVEIVLHTPGSLGQMENY